MAAIASIEDLAEAKKALDNIKEKNVEAYADFALLFSTHRAVGYKNIVKMLYGKTPEELKE